MEEPLSEEVLIQLSMEYSQVERATAALKKQMLAIHGEMGAVEEAINSFGSSFAKVMGNKTIPLQLAFAETWRKSIDGVNGMIEAMRTLASSSGLAVDQFSSLNDSIRQAATETGGKFEDIATGAKNLFEATGLKAGLSEAVLDAERMNKVFGSTRESFGKLAARFTQFSEGAGNANDLMKAFSNVTGIVGARLDAVLDHMTEISKKLRNIAGGGKDFASSMKANTEFTAKMAAKFAEMGGDPQAFMDIQSAILDPNKWDEIGQKMPGMAKYFVQMQDSMVKGDIDSFAKFLKLGAQDTAAMGKNMSVLARSAVGMDFTSVELLSKMNWKSLKTDGMAAGSVLERSAKQIRALGEQVGIFFTNLAAAIMPVVGPIIEMISTGFSYLNSFLASMQGTAMSVFVTLGMVGIGVLTIWKLWKRFVMMAPKELETVGEAVGNTLGKTVEKASTGIANGLSNFVTILAKNAVQLLAVGAGFMLMGAGLWMVAEAIATVGKLSLSDVAVGLLGLGAAVLIFSVAAMALGAVAMTPMFWMGILAITSIGIALNIFGEAVLAMGTGMKAASEGIKEIVSFAPGLAVLATIDLTGLTRLGMAMKDFNANTSGVTIGNGVLDSIRGLVDVVSKLGTSMVDIVVAGDLATKYGPQIKAAVGVVTDHLADAVTVLNDKLVHFFGNTTISDNVQKSLKFVVELFNSIPEMMIQMVSLGTVMASDSGQMKAAMTAGITYAVGSISTALKFLDEELQSGMNKDLTESVRASMETVTKTLTAFATGYQDIAVFGAMLDRTIGQDGNGNPMSVSGAISRAVLKLYGPNGIFALIAYHTKDLNIDATKMDTMKKAADNLAGMMDPMIQVSAAGNVFSDGKFADGVRAYVGNVGFFLRSMLGLYDSVGDQGFAKLTKMPELVGKFRSAMDNDIKMSAKGGAEVALDEHDNVTRDHYAKVEMLLTGILTAIQGGKTPQAVAQSAESAPIWDPAILFGGNDEGTF